MKKPVLAGAAAAFLAIVVGGYWYWSPLLALKGMFDAAQQSRAEAFNTYVDYPRLRESLKGHVAALMVDKDAEPKESTGMGKVLAVAFANAAVEAMVRPEVVMMAVQAGRMDVMAGREKPTSSQVPGDAKKTDYRLRRVDPNTLHVDILDALSGDVLVSIGMERSGFATWKVVDLDPNFGRLAQR